MHWDGSVRGTSFTDLTGNGFSGALTGNWAMSTGVVGDAMVADGSTTWASADPGEPQTWTISQWVRADSLPSGYNAYIASIGSGPVFWTGWGVLLGGDGRIGAYAQSGVSSQEQVLWSEETCVGGWTHVVATWEAGTLRIYLDGALASSLSPGFTTILYGANDFFLGNDPNQPFRLLHAGVDEVMLWDARLSDEEVGQLFEDGACHRETAY